MKDNYPSGSDVLCLVIGLFFIFLAVATPWTSQSWLLLLCGWLFLGIVVWRVYKNMEA